MRTRAALIAVLAVVGIAAASGDARAGYWRGGSYYADGFYGSVHGGGLLGGPWGWYGERRGFYGGFYGAYSDGAKLRPVDGRPYDPSRCENIFTKVAKKGVMHTRQIFRCH